MTSRKKAYSDRTRTGDCGELGGLSGLLARVRHKARRRRNLAELRALDAGRLQDIGLSAAARARMIG